MNFDDKFVEKLVSKDKNAFNELYLQTVDIFYRYLKSNYFISDSDAEDIVSNFYLKVWNGLGKYKYMKNFSSWLRTIFRNTIKDDFKKVKEKHFSNYTKESDEELENSFASDENILDLLQSDYEYDKIKKSIDNLDDISKDIIYLKYIEEKSNKEISIILEISEDNVRQRISRAMKKLKENIDTN
ncbi:MAG: RNA polymerase sigma factor [Candidatus Absconditabacteria bacterium]